MATSFREINQLPTAMPDLSYTIPGQAATGSVRGLPLGNIIQVVATSATSAAVAQVVHDFSKVVGDVFDNEDGSFTAVRLDNTSTVIPTGKDITSADGTVVVVEGQKTFDLSIQPTINYFNNTITSTKNDLLDEIARATSAETNLNLSIQQEIANRKAGDLALQDQLDDITYEANFYAQTGTSFDQSYNSIIQCTTSFRNIINSLTYSITDSLQSATVSYAGVMPASAVINLNQNNQKLIDLEGAIDAEIIRATSAEAVLQDQIDTNTQAIQDEADARSDADDAIWSQVNINTSAISGNAQAIADETARATSAESGLNQAIYNESQRAAGAEAGLASQISTEANTRAQADANLQANIDTNTLAIAANAANISSLQTSAATAASNIGSLQGQMTSAQGAISSLQTSASTAASNISTLQSAINKTVQTNFAVTSDSDSVDFTKNFVNISTGAATTGSATIPTASNSTAGIMDVPMFNQFTANTSAIATLQQYVTQQGRKVVASGLGTTPSQAQLTTAFNNVYPGTINAGDQVFNTDDGDLFIYNNSGTWVQVTGEQVPLANTSTAGLAQHSTADGAIGYFTAGQGQVNGWTSVKTSATTALTNITTHAANTSNPHSVTLAQVGGAPANATLSAGSGSDTSTPAVASTAITTILQTIWNRIYAVYQYATGKQAQLNGTGYVKQSGTATSYQGTPIPAADGGTGLALAANANARVPVVAPNATAQSLQNSGNGAFFATAATATPSFGTLPIAQGGTGLTAAPSLLTNLATSAAASLLASAPRPGVTGVLPIANGGTNASSLPTGILKGAGTGAITAAVSGTDFAAPTVARTNTASSATLAWSGSFPNVVAVNTNGAGQVTGTITSTYTLPAAPTAPGNAKLTLQQNGTTISSAFTANASTDATYNIPGVAQNVALGTTTGTANSLTGGSLPVSGTLPIGAGGTGINLSSNASARLPAIAANGTTMTTIAAAAGVLRTTAAATTPSFGTVTSAYIDSAATWNAKQGAISSVVGNDNASAANTTTTGAVTVPIPVTVAEDTASATLPTTTLQTLRSWLSSARKNLRYLIDAYTNAITSTQPNTTTASRTLRDHINLLFGNAAWLNANKQAQLNGTGYVKQSGTTTSYQAVPIPTTDGGTGNSFSDWTALVTNTGARGWMPNNTNWDSYITPGLYYWGDGALPSGTNPPPVSYSFGTLLVLNSNALNGANAAIVQMAITHYSEIWTRSKWDSASWMEWSKVLTGINAANQLVKGDGTVTPAMPNNTIPFYDSTGAWNQLWVY